MYEQYSKLISLYLEINPEPSDAQFHALAEACGVDKETLEAVAYRMLGEHEGMDVPIDVASDNERFSGEALAAGMDEDDLLGEEDHQTFDEQAIGDIEEEDGLTAAMTPGVDEDRMSVEERVMSDDVNQDYLDYNDAALADGSLDPKDSTAVQEDTNEDGGTEPYDQSETVSDGPVVPSITKKADDDTEDKLLSRLVARLRTE